jgi:hypothetical protein
MKGNAMKNRNIEVRNADPAPLSIYILSVFVVAFAVATGLCFWHGDVAAVLALLCICPMTLISVVGHEPLMSVPERVEIKREHAIRGALIQGGLAL